MGTPTPPYRKSSVLIGRKYKNKELFKRALKPKDEKSGAGWWKIEGAVRFTLPMIRQSRARVLHGRENGRGMAHLSPGPGAANGRMRAKKPRCVAVALEIRKILDCRNLPDAAWL